MRFGVHTPRLTRGCRRRTRQDLSRPESLDVRPDRHRDRFSGASKAVPAPCRARTSPLELAKNARPLFGVLIGGNCSGGFQLIDMSKPLTDAGWALVLRNPFDARAGKTLQEPLNAGDDARHGTGSSQEHRHGGQSCREVSRLARWTVPHRKTLIFKLFRERTNVGGRADISEPSNLH